MSGVEASDDELVQRTANGDQAAFTQLVARHQRRLLALMTRAVGNRAAAEDIVQDVFAKAWVNAPLWQTRNAGRASYAAWLARVAVNLAIDQSRRARPTRLEEIDEPTDPTPLPEDRLIAQQRQARIQAEIQKLPERQRLALSLTYDAELSNAEGAAAMSTSIGAFELLLVRARHALRIALRDA